MRERYNRHTVTTITGPTTAAVTLAEAKHYLAIDGAQDDLLIERLITSATETMGKYLRRTITTRTLLLTMDGFARSGDEAEIALGPGMHTVSIPFLRGAVSEIVLPFPPVQSVSSVKAFDLDNSETTVPSADYFLDVARGVVVLNEGRVWPVNLRRRAAVQVQFVAGYTAIPEPIRQGILDYVGCMYECRGHCALPDGAKTAVDGYRIMTGFGA